MKVVINSIIQVGGKPEKIVIEALKNIQKTIDGDKKFKVIKNTSSDLEFEKESGFFIGFVESEIEFSDTRKLMDFLFFYNPNNIEIISPSKLKFGLNEINGFLNNIIVKNLENKEEIRNLRAHIHLVNKKK